MKQSELALLVKGMAPVIGQLLQEAVQPLAERLAEVEQQLAAKTEPLPPVVDGAVIEQAVQAAVEKAVAALPVPADGIDVDMTVVGEQVAQFVKQTLDAWERPANGASVTVDDVAPMIAREVEKAVGALPVPADGAGVTDAMQRRDGHLVFTLSNGKTIDVGMVAGKDADMDAIGAKIKALFDALPRPADGVDGFGFDDLDLVEDEKGVVLRFAHGDVFKDFPLPVVFDRGVFKDGGSYRKGNGVTWGGSYWIAQKDDPGKPDTPESGWRLAVKKGQNGKDLTR